MKGECTQNSSRTKNLKKKKVNGEIPLNGSFSAQVALDNCMTKRIRNTCMDFLGKGLGSCSWCLQRRETSQHSEHRIWSNQSAPCDAGKASAAITCPGLPSRCGPSDGHLGRQHEEKSTYLESPYLFLPTGIMKTFERSNCSNSPNNKNPVMS